MNEIRITIGVEPSGISGEDLRARVEGDAEALVALVLTRLADTLRIPFAPDAVPVRYVEVEVLDSPAARAA